MIEEFQEFFNRLNFFDIVFIFILIYFVIQCFVKGFSLSLISFLKWILSTVITIILLPKFQPVVSEYVESDFINSVGLSVAIFIFTLFRGWFFELLFSKPQRTPEHLLWNDRGQFSQHTNLPPLPHTKQVLKFNSFSDAQSMQFHVSTECISPGMRPMFSLWNCLPHLLQIKLEYAVIYSNEKDAIKVNVGGNNDSNTNLNISEGGF